MRTNENELILSSIFKNKKMKMTLGPISVDCGERGLNDVEII
jgi:hypothetical protein